MERKTILLVRLLIFILAGCKNNKSIDGIREVRHVKEGDQDRIPDARWMRFNAVASRQLGNRWLQYYCGTWSLNESTGEVYVTNTNGLNDPNEPLDVSVGTHTIYRSRNEEGQMVEILLDRSDRIPAIYGDKLLELRRSKSAYDAGPFFTASNVVKECNSFIFY